VGDDASRFATLHHYDQWNKDGHWEAINMQMVAKARQAVGRDPQPSLSAVDSQSVKTAEKGGSIQGSMATLKDAIIVAKG
jgi:putative transposase